MTENKFVCLYLNHTSDQLSFLKKIQPEGKNRKRRLEMYALDIYL